MVCVMCIEKNIYHMERERLGGGGGILGGDGGQYWELYINYIAAMCSITFIKIIYWRGIKNNRFGSSTRIRVIS